MINPNIKVGSRFLDLSGRLFTRWMVSDQFKQQRRPSGRAGAIYWLCTCTCPLGISKWIRSSALTVGNSQSCGCLQRELMSAQQFEDQPYSCRQDVAAPKDLSDIWRHIIRRCLNPKHHEYHRYGGCGITICDRWRYSLKAFLEDLPTRPSRKHTIHRIDNDKGYEPGNVQWLTRQEHSMLHHHSQYVVVDGIKDSVAATARRTGVCSEVFRLWMGRGYSAQEIVDQESKPGIRPKALFPMSVIRPTRHSKLIIQYQGRSMSLAEATEKAGVNHFCIRNRMKRWDCTFEEALRADRKEQMLGWRRFLSPE